MISDTELQSLQRALSDRYRLERQIGRGGMAVVFLAEDLRHRRSVAIKVLDPQVADSIGAARFLREIEIAARLVHPHILSLLDSGEASGLLYYVMPYVAGDSLAARLKREGELQVDVALRILKEVLDALAYAHGEGLVHRDVKPENILFVSDHIQISDFGLAKAVRAATGDGSVTGTGFVVGTPAYMAPEQAAGSPELDHRVDIYAAGLVAYQMLAGVLPFRDADPLKLAAARVVQDAEPLHRLKPDLPPELSAFVMRCLEKRPADRWQTCEEALHELDRAIGSQGSGSATPLRLGREVEKATLKLTEDICRKLDRASFDPRMLGDGLHYLDNRGLSATLVCCFPACGLPADHFTPFLESTRYRAMALTPYGFEAERKKRPSLPLADHLVLAGEWLRAMAAQSKPRLVLLAGFSSGGDVALRLAARDESVPLPIDGCLALGANLSLETCFVTQRIGTLSDTSEESLVATLRAVGAGAGSLDDWINVHDYLLWIARKFRGQLEPLQSYAMGITEPFEAGPLVPFVGWYRDATRLGRRLRCVFDDWDVYHRLIRELHLRNLDEKILGESYDEDSILLETEASHFDLMAPERIERHLNALEQRISRATGRRPRG